jgi:hypothetical protein
VSFSALTKTGGDAGKHPTNKIPPPPIISPESRKKSKEKERRCYMYSITPLSSQNIALGSHVPPDTQRYYGTAVSRLAEAGGEVPERI